MPTTLYVAGPVVDPREGLPDFYKSLLDLGEARGWNVRLPLRRDDTASMPPHVFADWVAHEISGSDAVLAIVVDGDQSVPSEITTAAREAKPQVLMAPQPDRVPRLLAGQPGVLGVASFDDVDAAFAALGEATEGPAVGL